MFSAAKNALSAAKTAASAVVDTATSATKSVTNAGLNTLTKKLAQVDQMAKDLEQKTAAKTGGKAPKRKATLHDSDAPELSGPKRSKSKKAKKPRAKPKPKPKPKQKKTSK